MMKPVSTSQLTTLSLIQSSVHGDHSHHKPGYIDTTEEYREKVQQFCRVSLSFCEIFLAFENFCKENEILILCEHIDELAKCFYEDNPDYSFDDSRDYLIRTRSYGFTAQKENKIYALSKGKHGAYHELMHLLSAPDGKTKMFHQISANMMEGTNEYFTREVESYMSTLESETLKAYPFTYPKQCQFIQIIITACGESVTNALYQIHFCKEDIDLLINAMLLVWQQKSQLKEMRAVYKTPPNEAQAKKFLTRFLTEVTSNMDGGSDDSIAIGGFQKRFPVTKPAIELPLPPPPPPPLPGKSPLPQTPLPYPIPTVKMKLSLPLPSLDDLEDLPESPAVDSDDLIEDSKSMEGSYQIFKMQMIELLNLPQELWPTFW